MQRQQNRVQHLQARSMQAQNMQALVQRAQQLHSQYSRQELEPGQLQAQIQSHKKELCKSLTLDQSTTEFVWDHLHDYKTSLQQVTDLEIVFTEKLRRMTQDVWGAHFPALRCLTIHYAPFSLEWPEHLECLRLLSVQISARDLNVQRIPLVRHLVVTAAEWTPDLTHQLRRVLYPQASQAQLMPVQSIEVLSILPEIDLSPDIWSAFTNLKEVTLGFNPVLPDSVTSLEVTVWDTAVPLPPNLSVFGFSARITGLRDPGFRLPVTLTHLRLPVEHEAPLNASELDRLQHVTLTTDLDKSLEHWSFPNVPSLRVDVQCECRKGRSCVCTFHDAVNVVMTAPFLHSVSTLFWNAPRIRNGQPKWDHLMNAMPKLKDLTYIGETAFLEVPRKISSLTLMPSDQGFRTLPDVPNPRCHMKLYLKNTCFLLKINQIQSLDMVFRDSEQYPGPEIELPVDRSAWPHNVRSNVPVDLIHAGQIVSVNGPCVELSMTPWLHISDKNANDHVILNRNVNQILNYRLGSDKTTAVLQNPQRYSLQQGNEKMTMSWYHLYMTLGYMFRDRHVTVNDMSVSVNDDEIHIGFHHQNWFRNLLGSLNANRFRAFKRRLIVLLKHHFPQVTYQLEQQTVRVQFLTDWQKQSILPGAVIVLLLSYMLKQSGKVDIKVSTKDIFSPQTEQYHLTYEHMYHLWEQVCESEYDYWSNASEPTLSELSTFQAILNGNFASEMV